MVPPLFLNIVGVDLGNLLCHILLSYLYTWAANGIECRNSKCLQLKDNNLGIIAFKINISRSPKQFRTPHSGLGNNCVSALPLKLIHAQLRARRIGPSLEGLAAEDAPKISGALVGLSWARADPSLHLCQTNTFFFSLPPTLPLNSQDRTCQDFTSGPSHTDLGEFWESL